MESKVVVPAEGKKLLSMLRVNWLFRIIRSFHLLKVTVLVLM